MKGEWVAVSGGNGRDDRGGGRGGYVARRGREGLRAALHLPIRR